VGGAVDASSETQEIVLGCMAELAAALPLKPAMIRAHAVDACVEALREGGGGTAQDTEERAVRERVAVHAAAATVLLDLATDCTQSSVCIGTAGGCEALVALLVRCCPSASAGTGGAGGAGGAGGDSSGRQAPCVDEVQEKATAALVQLATDPGNRQRLVQEGALHTLRGLCMTSAAAHASAVKLVQVLQDQAGGVAGPSAKRQRQ
jgi:hypothetical protein